MSSRKSEALQSIEDFRKKLYQYFEDAKFSHKLASARLAANNSKGSKPHAYSLGDEVWLSHRYFTDS